MSAEELTEEKTTLQFLRGVPLMQTMSEAELRQVCAARARARVAWAVMCRVVHTERAGSLYVAGGGGGVVGVLRGRGDYRAGRRGGLDVYSTNRSGAGA